MQSRTSGERKRKRCRSGWIAGAVVFFSLLWAEPLRAEASGKNKDLIDELFEMPFEKLMNVEVFSVTRTAGQDWFTSPAALYVISPEDIRRSGHQEMPELLRMVPGLHVAQSDANTWAIGSRGFSSRFNSTLLVQRDGHSLYTPVFAGVVWEAADYILEDLAQVEVIRGPGGSLWGANAVNGIINFTSKEAKDTQGWLMSTGVGTELQYTAIARYGGQLDDNVFYRVYGKAVSYDDGDPTTIDYTDDYHRQTGGFRIDWRDNPDDTFTLQGDIFDGHYGTTVKDPDVAAGTVTDLNSTEKYNGWNVLGRWNRTISEDQHLQLQMYYDWTEGHFPPEEGSAFRIGQFDVDFQHDFILAEGHKIVWGLGYHRTAFNATDGDLVRWTDNDRDLDTFSTFIQDTIRLVPSKLDLIVGTKVENNDITGTEYQPSARLVYMPDNRNTFWAGVTRAVQVPAIGSDSVSIIAAVPFPGVPATIEGNSDLKAMRVDAYEAGWRVQPTDKTALGFSLFYNDYDHDQFGVTTGLTTNLTDTGSAETYGFEVVANWELADNWRLMSGYGFLREQRHPAGAAGLEDDTPRNIFNIRSYYDIAEDMQLNAALYYYDNSEPGGVSVPAWFRFDLGLVWQVDDALELSLWGQNLLEGQHPEFGPDVFVSNGFQEIERNIFLKATWRY